MDEDLEIHTYMIVGESTEEGAKEVRVFDVFGRTERGANELFVRFKPGPPYCQFEEFFLVRVVAERTIREQITQEELAAWQKRNARVPCKMEDTIKCLSCGKISKVSELAPRPGKWGVVYYYCPCDSEHPKAVDQGGGSLLVVFLAKAELVQGGS